MQFQTQKRPQFPRSRSFKVKLVDRVLLTPTNDPTKFSWDNQNILGEKKCKSVIFLFKMAAIISGISAKLRELHVHVRVGPGERFNYTF